MKSILPLLIILFAAGVSPLPAAESLAGNLASYREDAEAVWLEQGGQRPEAVNQVARPEGRSPSR